MARATGGIRRKIAATGLAVLVAAAACSGGSGTQESDASDPGGGSAAPSAAGTDTGNSQHFGTATETETAMPSGDADTGVGGDSDGAATEEAATGTAGPGDADSGIPVDTGSGSFADTESGIPADTGSAPSAGTETADSGSGDPVDTGTADPPSAAKSCKRGVAYGHHSAADLAALAPGISWWYNWYFAPEDAVIPAYRDLGVEFVPMYWGTGVRSDQVAAGMPDDAAVLLGFNEPNFFAQANLSAQEAAAAWPTVQQVADARGLYLVSPAVNFCGGGCHQTDPVAYLQDFFAACTGCRVDAVAVHIYVECRADDPGLQSNRAQWLINHLQMYEAAFSQPLWVTEFACSGNPTVEEQRAFLLDAVAYLEADPRVERYAWFAGRADNMTNVDLLGSDGQLTALGEAYVTAPFDPSCVGR